MSSDLSKQRRLLFPLLSSYNMTRVILSYFTPFELETTVSLLNKWSHNFVKGSINLSLLYGRKDLRAIVVSQDHTLSEYDIAAKSLVPLKPVEGFPRKFTKFVSIETTDNRIFIAGGYDTSIRKIVAFLYELKDECVAVPLNTTHYGRVSFSLAIMAGKLYMVGGFNAGTLKICEKMDLRTCKWRTAPSLNMKRCSPILCTFGGNTIYAFGGTDGYSPLNSVERLRENSRTWESLPDFCERNSPQLRIGGVALQISHKEIMILGGHTGPYKQPMRKCVIYNAIKRKVTATVDMKEPEEGTSLGLYREHEKVYAVGLRVHIYDCKSKGWEVL